MTSSRLARLCQAGVAALAAATAGVLACGPFLTDMRPVQAIRPGQTEPYARGELGVVREHFARRYLVQAYRRLEGRPPIAAVGERFVPAASVDDAIRAWSEAHKALGGGDAPINPTGGPDRNIGDYQWITNCLADAFSAAAATAKSRAITFGERSPALREWFTAQDTVFANCSGKDLVLPAAAPSADPLTRGDRAYQTAAAYFYAMRYDEALTRFRQIAADAASSWRPYGHYLAGRTLLRQATTAKTLDRAKLEAARAELRLAVADPAAASLKASATGLLEVIGLRLDPVARLREVSAPLAGEGPVSIAQLNEYERVMDTLVGDATFDFAALDKRDAIAGTADLNDWVVTMQGTGDAALAHAIAQWQRAATQQRGSAVWLVAALWKVPAAHASAAGLLDAAARVPASSPAFFTVSFLRTRLLAARGDVAQARTVLAGLPTTSPARGDAEAVNLLNAIRFEVAPDLGALLAAAPRLVVNDYIERWRSKIDAAEASGPPQSRPPVFDDDAGIVFSSRLPLARLVEAATSDTLPARLRLRVAAAAFTRAWLLHRDDEARSVSPVLRSLSPDLSADLQRFESAATDADRHVAGLAVLLRTPGLRANVRGLEDDEDYFRRGLARAFDHTFRRNWWCEFPKAEPDAPQADSQVLALVYPSGEIPYPSFLSAAERAATERERAALAALGPAPNYLANEAVKWAKGRPSDAQAAEALAHAVEGTRWGCGDEKTSAASRLAFQTLHNLFPKSEWALKTKYWY
jgi:hypothetical protein